MPSHMDGQSRLEFAEALTGLVARRHQMDARKARVAEAAAEAIVAELVTVARDRLDRELEDDELEDELCAQFGGCLREWADEPFEDRVRPTLFAEAIVTAAAATVRAALRGLTTDPDGWRAAWRVLTVAAGIVPYPVSATAAEVIDDLRKAAGGRVLPKTVDGPTMTGQVLWTRDAYGSRFGIIAAFSTPNKPDRWYLWDIDACGYQPFIVHSGYYSTSEQALAAWQAGVGKLTAADTAFTPVDNPWLLADLMYVEEGAPRADEGGADLFTEYYRSRRLAETTRRAVYRNRPGREAGLGAANAATQFTAWLRTHRAGQSQPADLEELIARWNCIPPAPRTVSH
jgi:hypothetical protein